MGRGPVGRGGLPVSQLFPAPGPKPAARPVAGWVSASFLPLDRKWLSFPLFPVSLRSQPTLGFALWGEEGWGEGSLSGRLGGCPQGTFSHHPLQGDLGAGDQRQAQASFPGWDLTALLKIPSSAPSHGT